MWMAAHARDEAWWHTAFLAAMTLNTAFGKRGSPVHPARLHPFLAKKWRSPGIRLTRAALGALKGLAAGRERRISASAQRAKAGRP